MGPFNPGRAVRNLAALACVLAPLLAAGCAAEEEPELSGRFGPGAGGASGTTLGVVDLTRTGGAPVGHANYWNERFAALGARSDRQFDNLAHVSESILVTLVRIVGRPDTPCRFQAALLARDDGFEIEASGDRKNDQNLEFHQVNLKRNTTHLRFYCATLRANVGVMVQVLTVGAALQDWVEVHFILNSIGKA